MVFLKKHPLGIYFFLSYAISWSIGIPLVLQSRGSLNFGLPFEAHYLIGYGPLLAALGTGSLLEGKKGRRELLDSLLRWRVGILWWGFAFSPLILLGFVEAGLYFFQSSPLKFLQLGKVSFLPSLGAGIFPFWFFTFGLGEEIGWRGFALPRLQSRYSATGATIRLWFFWALWHTPMFFYMYPIRILPGFFLGILAGSFLFTWLYNSTGGSVLITAIWHGAFNATTACELCKGGAAGATISTAVMIWAVVLVFLFGRENLSHRKKVTLE